MSYAANRRAAERRFKEKRAARAAEPTLAIEASAQDRPWNPTRSPAFERRLHQAKLKAIVLLGGKVAQ